MEKKKQFCLWCNTELENGLFCIGGGKTISQSNTGENGTTKSYCLTDFKTMVRLTNQLGLEQTEQEKEFLLYESDIREWYASIPMTFEVQEDAKN